MKLWGVAMVRDEADIIEAFVRHNLTVVDGLTIVDHGSSDGTAEILAALAAEGLPLRTTVDSSADFRQSAVITRLARDVFTACDPDYIFLLDADEFLKVARGSRRGSSRCYRRSMRSSHGKVTFRTSRANGIRFRC